MNQGTSARAESPWQDVVLIGAEVVTLRLMGRTPGGQAVELRYDLGTVTATITDTSARQVSTYILDLPETVALLAVLRQQAQAAPRLRQVSSSALHAFISALSVSLNSPGPIPFGTAAFGSAEHASDGQIVGQLILDSRTRASIITMPDDDLRFEMHPSNRSAGASRRLSAGQLHSLIPALRTYLAAAGPAANPLWRQILAHAIARDNRYAG